MLWTPCLVRSSGSDGEVRASLGDPLVDDYLRFVAARSRPNTVLATAYDLKVFFSVVGKEPVRVSTTDVMEFLAAQRAPRRGPRVVRLEDGESGLSARTLKRRLASVSGLFAYLLARDDVEVRRNPVPRGLGTRRPLTSGARGVPLIRTPRTLPKVLSPVEVDALLGALRTHRDRALVLAMLLGGLRRCEVLGLRMSDVHAGERRLFIVEGKGGHQRIVPVANRFFASLADYFDHERPNTDVEHVFVVLRGPNRGRVLTAAGVDQVLDGARQRAALDHATCHQLRHTCLTRLREAGMAEGCRRRPGTARSSQPASIYTWPTHGWPRSTPARSNAIEHEIAERVEEAEN